MIEHTKEFLDIKKKYPRIKALEASKKGYFTFRRIHSDKSRWEIAGYNQAYGFEIVYYKLKEEYKHILKELQ